MTDDELVRNLDALTPGYTYQGPYGDHGSFAITKVLTTALHTGRPLYSIRCLRCNKLVHDATTGPCQMMRSHIRETRESRSFAALTDEWRRCPTGDPDVIEPIIDAGLAELAELRDGLLRACDVIDSVQPMIRDERTTDELREATEALRQLAAKGQSK